MPRLSPLTRLLIWALRKRPEVLRFTLEFMPQDLEPVPDEADWFNADDDISPLLDYLDDDIHLQNCTDYLEHMWTLPPASPHGGGGRSEAP
jgi:hypothetical protein